MTTFFGCNCWMDSREYAARPADFKHECTRVALTGAEGRTAPPATAAGVNGVRGTDAPAVPPACGAPLNERATNPNL